MSDHACSRPDCPVCWLFLPGGPDDPAWLARVKAEATSRPSLVGRARAVERPWATGYPCCRICATTDRPHAGHGRCSSCRSYWQRRGVERPVGRPEGRRAS